KPAPEPLKISRVKPGGTGLPRVPTRTVEPTLADQLIRFIVAPIVVADEFRKVV
ncbi:hypothetical protein PSYPI_45578, partial [Pseudomonas syringae pv. pisi str. 1704B]